jgi:flavorubredoxin
METRIDEIADGIFRLSTYVPQIAAPAGFTFNQFLVKADEPLLFHCGHRRMFPQISEALGRLMPINELRWISFGHLEADECGAMNDWLAAVPQAEIAFGGLGCMISLDDMADRKPRGLAEGEVLDLGGRQLRYLATPHLPHNWEAGLFFEEETGTLLCGDLFTHIGKVEPLTAGDILAPAIATEEKFLASALAPDSPAILHKLAALKPKTLALMHGASFNGDCATALDALAVYFAGQIREA